MQGDLESSAAPRSEGGPKQGPADTSGADGRRVTPMLRQYLDAKAEAPRQAILMFRMGDFFELFFEDAVTASRELELTLTSRDKDRGEPIPMAGVPHHAVDGYIARLVQKGYTVAICDQLEDPKQAKGIVKRGITRLVTPGTVSDLEALDPTAASYLGYVARYEEGPGAPGWVLALFELLSGELLVTRVGALELGDELSRMAVRELLVEVGAVPEGLGPAAEVPRRELEGPAPSEAEARALLGERAAGEGHELEPLEAVALARVVTYAEATQRRRLTHLMAPRRYRAADHLVLDEATRRNLELVRVSLRGERKGSLLWHLDRCKTAMGSRLLSRWLLFPLRELEAIRRRHDVVEALAHDRTRREAAQRVLADVRDVERLTGRVAVGRASPRDLLALKQALACLPHVSSVFADHSSPLTARWRGADLLPELTDELQRAICDEPPHVAADGGIFRRGYRADLDALMSLSQDGHDFLADLERRERARSGIPSLKVRFNKVFGYYIEITKANLGAVPKDYVRKQTLVGAERFITDELKQYEDKVLHADERRRQRELELFGELLSLVGRSTSRLRAVSRLIAETDACLSLAQVADEGRYVRPELTEAPVLELEQSRHPVVERLLPGGERFVPNDVTLDADSRQLVIVTGPNMAGKSTVMRQVGLCVLLAHMGAFVPARRARIGLCDRLFTRVGAGDDLGRGQSTFMVEMVETAAILGAATRQSLVLLDEIGRGTSTFDGVSIAWAVAEHLHDRTGCRAMFATHYHELVDLALERPRIVNMSVAVKEHQGRIVFLRRLVDGAANRSYGIQVARLAGLPEPVLERAREILANLERGELDDRGMPVLAQSRQKKQRAGQLGLFSARPPAPEPVSPALARLAEELGAADVDRTTPLEALVLLARLKKLLQADDGTP